MEISKLQHLLYNFHDCIILVLACISRIKTTAAYPLQNFCRGPWLSRFCEYCTWKNVLNKRLQNNYQWNTRAAAGDARRRLPQDNTLIILVVLWWQQHPTQNQTCTHHYSKDYCKWYHQHWHQRDLMMWLLRFSFTFCH